MLFDIANNLSVSILILMEVTLEVMANLPYILRILRFNPYSNGSYSGSYPHSNLSESLDYVSILILMEVTLEALTEEPVRVLFDLFQSLF